MHYIQSSPFTIRWAGFESDTLKLQHNGWKLAVENNYIFHADLHQIRFILKHDYLQLIAITELSSRDIDMRDGYGEWYHRTRGELPFCHIQAIGREIVYAHGTPLNIRDFQHIDAMPKMVEKKLSEISLFSTIIQPDSAFIVEPEQISQLLEKIVACQAPKQKEIRERIKNQSLREALNQTVHAQIISMAA